MGRDYIDILNGINGVYSIVLLIIGTIGNIFCSLVCIFSPLRKTPTFVFYSIMLISDTVSMYIWNLDHFLLNLFQIQIENFGLLACKLATLVQQMSLQYSAWLLVAMSLERYISVFSINTKPINSIRAFYISAIILLVMMILNFPFAINLNYADFEKNNTTVECFGERSYEIWATEHIVVYCIIPFAIMLVTNILLLKQISAKRRNLGQVVNRNTNKRSLTVLILVTTSSFIVLTAPNAVVNGFFLHELFKTKYGTMVIFYIDSILFTFHGLNFFTLTVTNKRFSNQLRSIFYNNISTNDNQ